MAIWIFFPWSIAGDTQAVNLTITYLCPCTNLLYVPIYDRISFQSTMCGTNICASTRLIFRSVELGTTFRAFTRIIMLGTTFCAYTRIIMLDATFRACTTIII